MNRYEITILQEENDSDPWYCSEKYLLRMNGEVIYDSYDREDCLEGIINREGIILDK